MAPSRGLPQATSSTGGHDFYEFKIRSSKVGRKEQVKYER